MRGAGVNRLDLRDEAPAQDAAFAAGDVRFVPAVRQLMAIQPTFDITRHLLGIAVVGPDSGATRANDVGAISWSAHGEDRWPGRQILEKLSRNYEGWRIVGSGRVEKEKAIGRPHDRRREGQWLVAEKLHGEGLESPRKGLALSGHVTDEDGLEPSPQIATTPSQDLQRLKPWAGVIVTPSNDLMS